MVKTNIEQTFTIGQQGELEVELDVGGTSIDTFSIDVDTIGEFLADDFELWLQTKDPSIVDEWSSVKGQLSRIGHVIDNYLEEMQ